MKKTLLLCSLFLAAFGSMQAQDYTITTTGGNLVVTDNTGNGDVLSMSPSGADAEFNTSAARTYSLNGGGTMNFPVTITGIAGFNNITINQAGGNDQFDIGAFSGLKNLTINGGTGNDDVNFNGDITFASNTSLNVDLQDDDPTPGTDNVTVATNANLILSGTGTATVKVSRSVTVNAGGSIETVNRNLLVEANQQGTPTAGFFSGVTVTGAGSKLSCTGAGTLTVNGKGGNSVFCRGVVVQTGGTITGGTGLVSVTGTSGSSTSSDNYGVCVIGTGSTISSSGGNVSVTGMGGGSGTSVNNYGVCVRSAGQITAVGSGTVTVVGNGGTASTGDDNYGVYVDGTGSTITSSGGNVSVTGTGGGSGASNENYGVGVVSAGQITAGMSGTVTVVGNGGTTSTGFNNFGVYVEGNNSTITSSGGNVSVTGTGGGSGTGGGNYGVNVSSAGQITAGGSSSTVTVVGNGGTAPSGDSGYGVYVSGTDSKITSSGGNVSVTGTGGGSGAGGFNSGVLIRSAGQITADGSGTVTVEGNGGTTSTGNQNYGVNIEGGSSTISSFSGNVSVTGTGGGSGAGGLNSGVRVYAGGQITAGMSGTVTVVGNGGTTSTGNFNYGVFVASGTITSFGGNVSVTGTSGGSGESSMNDGVFVESAGRIMAGMSGTVTVVGNGGTMATGDLNRGVYVFQANSKITSSGGNVSVTGTGGGSGTSASNYGVSLYLSSEITAGGSGTVTVVGNGGTTSTGNNNYGVYFSISSVSNSSTITSSGGDVSVTGVEGGGPSGIGLVIASSNQVTTAPAGGNITLVANSMNIGAIGVSTPTGNSVTLRPYTNGKTIDLGSASDPIGGPLSLSDTELDRITTGTLNIGDANSNDITVSANITRPAATVINLSTGGAVNLSASALNSAGGNVNIDAATGTNPTATGTDVNTGASSTLDFATGNDLRIAINGTSVDAQYRQLKIEGQIDITGVDLVLSGSYTVTGGETFTIVNNDGSDAIIGTFNGLAQNATITNFLGSTLEATISYLGGDGNDVVLTVETVSDYTITTTGGNLVVTDNVGNGDVLSMLPSGANAIFNTSATRTYSLNGGTPANFPVTINNIAGFTNITINQAGGNDQCNIGAFSGLQNLTINGGTGNDNVNFNGDITFAGNANLNVDLQDDGGAVGEDNVTVATNANLILSGTGAATVKVSRSVTVNASGSIETVNGNLLVEANQQGTPTTGFFTGVTVTGAGSKLGCTGTGTLTVNGKGGGIANPNRGAVTETGSSISGPSRGVVAEAGGSITGGTGPVSVTGTGGRSLANNNYGVWVSGTGSTITSSGGNVSVTGTGGGSGSSSYNYGVHVNAGGQITAGMSGTVTVVGNGGSAHDNYNHGVFVSGNNSTISSSGGDVSVTGTSGGTINGNNYGVYVNAGGQITAGGSGTVTVVGKRGATFTGNVNYGVFVEGTNSKITSSGGDVSVTGTGGGSNGNNYGVYLISAGQITAGGSGTVTVVGNGATMSTGSQDLGVYVSGTDSKISSSGGNVSVTGTGGGSGSGNGNYGVWVASAGQITAGGSGTVTVVGNGGATTSIGGTNYGVNVSGTNSKISSSGGDVSVTGTGGGGVGAPGSNYGVQVSDGQITAGGSGTVTVVGKGGTMSTDGFNIGVSIGGTISTSGGNVSVTGVEGGGPSGVGIYMNGGQVTTHPGGGNITLIANSMGRSQFGSYDVSTPTGNSVTLRPYDNGVVIDLGSSSDPIGGPLSLSDTELDRITTGTLNIGDANSNDITVSDNITRPAATAINLSTRGAVNLNASALNSAGGNVNINAASGTNPSATGTDVNTGAGSTLSFATGNDLRIAINGTTVDAQYRQLKVEGKVDLTGVDLVFSGVHNVGDCEIYTIVNNDDTDAITGTFNGLAEGATLTDFMGSGRNATITYIGGTGNDVVITVSLLALAGPDQTGTATCGLTSVNLAANTPTVGTGAWSVINGTGGSFGDATSPTSTFSGTAGATYTLRWTVTAPCAVGTDDVTIVFNQNPTPANAGPDQTGATTCGLTSVNLAGNTPTVGTGTWSIINGTGGSLGDAASPTSTFSGTVGTTYTLRWTVSTPCTASTDDVDITFNLNPTAANAGPDQTGAATCGLNLITLAANTPTVGTGAWSIISGTGGSFGDAASPTSTFSGTAGTAYTLRWTVTNAPCATTDEVAVNFNQTPTFSACPASTVQLNGCATTANYTVSTNGPSALTYTFSGATTGSGSGSGSGSAFNGGTTAVTVTATSPCGTSTCTFSVQVTDNIVPNITCPGNLTRPTDANACTASVTYNNATATDNCALPTGQPVWVSGGTGTAQGASTTTATFAKGPTTVTWRATDAAGLTKTCTFRVIVNDMEAPTLTCPPAITANTGTGACSAVANYTAPPFTDNCAPTSGTSLRTSGSPSGSAFPVGTNTVTFRATDGAGRTSTCSLQVIVTDAQLPTITCPAPVTVTGSGTPCQATVFYASATASDNCDGTLTAFLASGLGTGSSFPVGVTTNTWRAVASNGQTTECAFTVTVSCSGPRGNEAENRDNKQLENSAASAAHWDFAIAPNPASREVQIRFAAATPSGRLFISDAQGRLVWSQKTGTTNDGQAVQVDVSDWAPGVYMVALHGEGAVVTKRLTIYN